jgi:Ricin-type beta-trefoil lectin domain
VVAWKCSPGASTQQWTGYSDGTLRSNGRCLDVTGPGVGAKVKIAACTGAASQKWAIGQVSSNDFGPLINTGTRTALTAPGASTANGTPLVMGPDRGDLSGPWRVSFHHYMAP